MYEISILIVGAGPTGLTLALDLARRGVAFRIIESADLPFSGSRGKGIQPRTLEIFEDLGIIDSILASGGPYPKFRFHFGPFSLRAGSLGSSKEASADIPYPNLWMVPQSRTEEIMRERLRLSGVEVEFGKALVKFEQDGDGVIATLASGEMVRASFLVGCDGGHSIVRKGLGVALEGDAVDEKSLLVADVEVAGLDRSDWHIWPLGKGGVVGLCPLPQTPYFQLIAKADAVGGDLEEAVYSATGYRVGRVAWKSVYRPSVRMVDRYRVGRVLLAGDAAHVHPPAGGQGLNTGVQDAYNLGWKIAGCLRGGPDSLLDTYCSERLPVAAAVLGLSKRLHQTKSIRRGDATNQLALHYRTSSLSSGDSLGGLSPGDRMPDLPLAEGRLFERMRGPHATELTTVEGMVILIRPDGYIARIGKEHCGEYGGEPVQQVVCTTPIGFRA